MPAIHPQFSAVLGDCLHNYRSALDHAVAALRKADGYLENRSSQWPVTSEKEKGSSHRAQKQLEGVAPAPRAVIERLQPYSDGDAARPFCVLNDLDNTDKHRRITLVLWTSKGLGTAGLQGVGVDQVRWLHGPIEPGAVVVEHPRGSSEMPLQLFAEVAVDEPQLGGSMHVSDLLWQVDFEVRGALNAVAAAYDPKEVAVCTGPVGPSGHQQGRPPERPAASP